MDLSIVVGIIVLGCSVLTMDIFLKPGEAVAREASLHGGGHALVVAMLAADGSVVPANPYLFDLSVSRVRADMQANGSNGASDTCFHAVMMEPASDCSGAPVAVVVQTDGDPNCVSVPQSCSLIAQAAHGLDCKRKFYGCQYDRVTGDSRLVPTTIAGYLPPEGIIVEP